MTRFPLLGCVLALAAALTGCQSQDTGADSGEAQRSAARPTTAAPQLQRVELPDDAAALATLMGRQIQLARSVRLSASTTTRSTGGQTATLEITGAVRSPAGRQPAGTLKTTQIGGQEPGVTETIVINETVYTRVEGEEHAPGKPWLRISREDLDGIDLGPTKEGFQQVYNESLQAVKEATAGTDLAALANGELTGDPVAENLDGVPVRRYVGETATETMADETGDARLRGLADAGVGSVPWTIWVDSTGLPRRFTMTMDIPNVGSITSQANYSAWGEALAINPPSTAQVATLAG